MSKSQVIQNLDNTCEFSDVSIATKLSETGWLTILSGSALKLYLHFASLDEKKIPLSGNNSKLKKELFFSKTTAIGAPQELEAFGLIRCVSVFDNGSKLFELNKNPIQLPSHWLEFFKKKKMKHFCIAALSSEKIDNNLLQEMAELCDAEKDNTIIQKTLCKLVLSIYDEININMDFLVKEEYIMDDFELGLSSIPEIDEDVTELFSHEEMGYFKNIEDDKRWQNALSNEELNIKWLCSIVQHYYVLFGMPSAKDILDIKAAYKICFPYQIKAAITKISSSSHYEGKVNSFAFILSLLQKGMFGTRASKGKGKNGGFKKEEETRVIGLKNGTASGTTIKDRLNEQMKVGGTVDFDKIFRR